VGFRGGKGGYGKPHTYTHTNINHALLEVLCGEEDDVGGGGDDVDDSQLHGLVCG